MYLSEVAEAATRSGENYFKALFQTINNPASIMGNVRCKVQALLAEGQKGRWIGRVVVLHCGATTGISSDDAVRRGAEDFGVNAAQVSSARSKLIARRQLRKFAHEFAVQGEDVNTLALRIRNKHFALSRDKEIRTSDMHHNNPKMQGHKSKNRNVQEHHCTSDSKE